MKTLGPKTKLALEEVQRLAFDIVSDVQEYIDENETNTQTVSELLSNFVSDARSIIATIDDGGDFGGEVDWDEVS